MRTDRLTFVLGTSLATALAPVFAAPAFGQTSSGSPSSQPIEEQPAPAPDDSLDDEENDEIIVTGQRRGTVIGDIPPENQLGARDIRATGATDVTELLEALAPQIGSARGRGGERPILLLEGQRISSFRELRDIPTEAIARVEILPEEVALRYGYRADQRVVNFILRERFRSTAARVEGRTATGGGYLNGLTDLTQLQINRGGRTTVNLRAEGNSPLSEAERDIALAGGSSQAGRGSRWRSPACGRDPSSSTGRRDGDCCRGGACLHRLAGSLRPRPRAMQTASRWPAGRDRPRSSACAHGRCAPGCHGR